MEEKTEELNSQGILIAASLILAAIYILTGRHKHFTVTLMREMLPKLLQDKMPSDVEAVLITSTYVSKDVSGYYQPLSAKEFEGAVINKMKDFFGKREN
jgi:hypothetical protein